MPTSNVNPTSNTTPDAGQGGTAVDGATNTGHASTTAASSGGGDSQKSCIWSTFSAPGVPLLSATLKVDFSRTGSFDALGGNNFLIDYSTDNGANWIPLRSESNVSGTTSGTDQAALSTSQDFAQVRVRDFLEGFSDPGGNGSMTATISGIRIEISFDVRQFMLSSMM